jgi:hypothetical protein
VRFVLVYARRRAHLRLGELLRDRIAASAPTDRGQAARDSDELLVRAFSEQLGDALGHGSSVSGFSTSNLGFKLAEWYSELVGPARPVITLEHLERVLDVIRNPSERLEETCKRLRPQARAALAEVVREPHLDRAASADFTQFLDWVVEGTYINVQDRIEEAKSRVLSFGIRDWSRWPVGGGCHAWAAGARSGEIMERLKAFGLVGRPSQRELKNVHICGEAVSDYQGFIEGALRSSWMAVETITRST